MLTISQPMLKAAQMVGTVSAAANLALGGGETFSHTVTWDAGSLGGEVTIEVADDPNFAGVWGFVGKSTGPGAPGASKVDTIPGTSLMAKYCRHRVSQQLAGGTVSSRVIGTE